MTKCEIIFYEKDNGEVPVEKFLNGLELKKRAKTMRTIDLLQNNGWKLRSPYSKELTDGILSTRLLKPTMEGSKWLLDIKII